MPNSDRASAVACAERIRLRTAQYLGNREAGALGVTISIGVTVGGAGDTAAEVIARADRALYDAKTNGKDTVRLSDAVRTVIDRALGVAGAEAATLAEALARGHNRVS